MREGAPEQEMSQETAITEPEMQRLREICLKLDQGFYDREDTDFINQLIDRTKKDIVVGHWQISVHGWDGENGFSIHRIPTDIFGKIDEINDILERSDFDSSENMLRILECLDELQYETDYSRLEGRYLSDELFEKLQTLFPNHPFVKKMEEQSEFVDSISLLENGQQAFERIIDCIRNARGTIYINMFVWRNDEIGASLAEELIKAAERGVIVTITKDALGGIWERVERGGSSFFHSSDRSMKERMLAYYTQSSDDAVVSSVGRSLLQRMLRCENIHITINNEQMKSAMGDHSKFFVFDEGRVIMGGRNVGDEYAGQDDQEGANAWHDYMLEFTSSLLTERLVEKKFGIKVGGVTGEEEENRRPDGGTSVDIVVNRNPALVPRLNESDVVRSFEIKGRMLDMLNNARNEIIIEMAYFGDDEITQAIISAAGRGVKVSLVLPGRANIQDDLNKATVNEIIKATRWNNLSVYLYPSMLHAKLLHVDGKMTFLGSANMNRSALSELSETNIFVNDAQCNFTRQVKSSLTRDMARSRKVTSGMLEVSSSVAFVERMI